MTFRLAIVLALLIGSASAAGAQVNSTNARFSVGIAIDRLFTLDDDATDSWGIGPVFRIGPDRGGWGPSFGLGWFQTDLPATVGGVTGNFAALKVRPVMAGLGYTFKRGPWSYDVGVAAGWTFNKAELLAAGQRYFEAIGAGDVEVSTSNSIAVRPRVRVWYDTSTRVAWMGSIGVLFVDPEVTLRAGPNRLSLDRNLTSFTIEGGVVFALF